MRITTGRIRDGHVDVREAALPEGSLVTIIAREVDEPFELTPQEEAELAAALDEADRGETVDDSHVRQLIDEARR